MPSKVMNMRARCYTFLLLLLTAIPLCAAPLRMTIGSHDVLVSLPASYDKGNERYPVIYVTDGDTQLDHTVASATALAFVQRAPETIVVGTLHRERSRELQDPSYLTWFERELVPTIDKKFRTQPYRVLAGYSLGGVFTLAMAVRSSQLFNAWIASSPSTTWKELSFEHFTPPPDFYLMVGGGDEDGLRKGVEELGARFSIPVQVFPDDDHFTTPIAGYEAALRKIFKPWFFRVSDTDDTTVLLAHAIEHYAMLTRRYGYEVPIPEGRIDRIGARALQAGDAMHAFETYEYGVKHYPDSERMRKGLTAAQEAASPSRNPRR